jgi:hypothetical protein
VELLTRLSVLGTIVFLTEVPEGRPKIAQRFIAGSPQDRESPVGTKEIFLCFVPFAPKRPIVPAGLSPSRPYPSDESLGYSLSPCGLHSIPFHRKQRTTERANFFIPLTGILRRFRILAIPSRSEWTQMWRSAALRGAADSNIKMPAFCSESFLLGGGAAGQRPALRSDLGFAALC